MSVHLRKDGAWVVRYREGGREKTRYFGKRPDAQAEARAFDAQLEHRAWVRRTPHQGAITFGELARLYVEAAPGRMESSTIDNLVIKLNARILPLLSAEPALCLTPQKLDHYVTARLREGYRRRPGGSVRYPKLVTIWREVTDVLAILRWSVDRGYILTYPAAGWRKPKRDDEVIAPPTADEAKRLINAAPEHLRRALLLSWYTGCRPGRELLSLSYSSIDWDRKTIFIASAKKNGPKSRTVYIHPDLYLQLDRWFSLDKAGYIVHFKGSSIASLKTAWAATKRRAGIKRRLRLYDIRHAFATYSLRATGDIKSISGVIGHSRTDTTAKFYTHTSPEQERVIVESIPSVTQSNS